MELSRLLTGDAVTEPISELTRINAPMSHMRTTSNPAVSLPASAEATPPANLPPKHVIFEYLLTETSTQRARLPMRVNIYPHDGTDSIVTTVKNFYGLYDGNGVSFEDKQGNTLIARYENFEDKMTIYVRVVDDVGSNAPTPSATNSPRRPRLQAAFELQPMLGNGHSISRSSSRAAKKRSASPQSANGHRSHSVSTIKARPKTTRVGSMQGDGECDSDSDAGKGSVTSSRRGKVDVVASAEISVENIVEGGRRKRARFDSSELPLFVPSQVPMPGSISSISPQRRTGPGAVMSPFQTSQHTFSYNLMPSPQSISYADSGYRTATILSGNSTQARGRHSGYVSGRHSISGPPGAIFPTPDPTVGSVISDEDVALQLMRLGDASNYSTHGRTSTSTIDDAFSGKADASSAEESDEGSEVEDHLLLGQPSHHYGHDHGHSDYSGEEYDDRGDRSFKGESDGLNPEEAYRNSKKSRSEPAKSSKSKVKKWKVKTGTSLNGTPHPNGQMEIDPNMSPGNLNFQHFQQPLREDEEDLSTKPRCQRCRKSKKGCDRQRPCGRCRDAGIGIEGCLSEDEGNGRKGRFGRHMGVPVKKGAADVAVTSIEGLTPPMGPLMSMAPPPLVGDKSKKRKR